MLFRTRRVSFALFASVQSLALVARLASAEAPALRWSRPIVASGGGWVRVVLPDDVVAACRAGLPDLRVRNGEADVAFVVEQSQRGLPTEWPARDVESTAGRETTAIIDRGAHPPPASEVTIEIDAPDFLKPIAIDASDDARVWGEIARGSIFATSAGGPRARMTGVSFAPNDRRYFRIRLDDRNGPPVSPRAVLTGAAGIDLSGVRAVALDLRPVSSEAGESTYSVDLPSANLAVSSIALAPDDPAFSRQVTVFERVLFRDEITRRVVGTAVVSRGPSGESLAIPLSELRGPALEVRVEDGTSPPLALSKATATITLRSVLFFAPPEASLSLDYGSSSLEAARYDLGSALSHGRPTSVGRVNLGDAIDHGASSPIGLPSHGAVVNESTWRTRTPIALPGGGGVTYLALDGVDARGGLRVVDATSHEVPYLFEQALHHARQTVSASIAHGGAKTMVSLSGLTAFREIDGVELTASGPDYFRRSVSVVESIRDARGVVGERVLGSALWERRLGETLPPLSVAISAPAGPSLDIRIEDGDNAPLVLGREPIAIERGIRRIDFVRAPGDSLALLTGNAAAGEPSYDLSLLGDALLAAPATAATLAPSRDAVPPEASPPKWFWSAVIAAGLVVAAALARTLRSPVR